MPDYFQLMALGLYYNLSTGDVPRLNDELTSFEGKSALPGTVFTGSVALNEQRRWKRR